MKYIDDFDFAGAANYYNEMTSTERDEKFTEEFESGMKNRYSAILDNYNNEKLSETDIKNLISLLQKAGVSALSYSQFDRDYQSLSTSKSYYRSGMKEFNIADYKNAAYHLGLVSYNDINYKAAQSKKSEAETLMLKNISVNDVEILNCMRFENGFYALP